MNVDEMNLSHLQMHTKFKWVLNKIFLSFQSE